MRERAWLLKTMNTLRTFLDTLKRYHDRHGQILPSKKLKEAGLRVVDEEEEEIERKKCNSKERVDDISNSKERIDGISNSDEQVKTESEAKA